MIRWWVMSAAVSQSLEAVFREVTADWDLLERKLIRGWEDQLRAMSAEMNSLRVEGGWLRGPFEVMGILGLERDEVRNCRMLCWLLDPGAGHGLGAAFLERFLDRAGIRVDPATLGSAVVRTEVTRTVILDGRPEVSRADLVITAGDIVVVVEAKIDAGLFENQVRKYVGAWPSETRFVVLTRHHQQLGLGHPLWMSLQAAPEGLDRWSGMSWRDIGDDLDAALIEKSGRPAPGRIAAMDYSETIRRFLRG
jgi:hypothetical protein